MKKWRCTICGQTFEGDVPPPDTIFRVTVFGLELE